MAEKDALLEYLKDYHVGEENAITDRDLKRAIGIGGQALRERVNSLRRKGAAVCSSKKGYFYAENAQEIVETINHLEGRSYSLKRAILGLEEALEEYQED